MVVLRSSSIYIAFFLLLLIFLCEIVFLFVRTPPSYALTNHKRNTRQPTFFSLQCTFYDEMILNYGGEQSIGSPELYALAPRHHAEYA